VQREGVELGEKKDIIIFQDFESSNRKGKFT
jgi:hypothetical protein